jgi:uncharacterized protein YebE (UPF0316 family)
LGYGIGTIFGLFISNNIIKSISTVLVITKNKNICKVISSNNYGGTIINTKGLKDNKNSYMIISQINTRKLKCFKKLINQFDKTALIITIDSKNVLNAYL